MPRIVFIFPGNLSTPTGGYVYDRRIAAGLRSLGWKVSVRPVDESFPSPTPAALLDAGKILAAIPVSTRTSAIPETVPDDACLLVPPDDHVAFSKALRQIFNDTELLSRLKRGARAARNRLRSWDQAYIAFHNELHKVSRR